MKILNCTECRKGVEVDDSKNSVVCDNCIEKHIQIIHKRSLNFNIDTSFELCNKILKNIQIVNKKILVICNLEILYKIKEKAKSTENLWFITDCELNKNAAIKLGINEQRIQNSEKGTIMPKFDIVISNPPYKFGKNSLFFMKFIKLAYSLIENDGQILFITPSTLYITRINFFKNHKREFEYINLDPSIKEKYFSGMGVGLFTFFLIKKGKTNPNSIVDYGDSCSTVNLDELPYNILDERNSDKLFESIMKKYYSKGTKTKIRGIGDLIKTTSDKSHIFKNQMDDIYCYPAYLSSKENKRIVYSKDFGKGYGIPKLAVAEILEPNRAERFSEFSINKSVGRYSLYFPVVDETEAKNIQQFFNTNFYKFLDKKKRFGRYAFLDIPDIDFQHSWTDTEFNEYFNLTLEEINYINNQLQ